ncbi:hypothetical protein SAMN05421640_3576 [Ekhidna lutea]|uniref:DUF5916 domain-containing protein n=1 Tax=Ekhidna lutea TaxID=447679 RepID=A0A239M1K7_EKHLU|nr:DUF5916 domain-containing protein [Ekhidna lutea]SNT36561.1 hypothetical protein SAMN05421640_3576 [Ekhidna lutea]
MNRTKKALTLSFLLAFVCGWAQNQPDGVDYYIESTDEFIELDGRLDEAIWKQLPRAGGFYQTFPTDNQPALDSTQFMITYTDKSIIIGVICYDYLEGDDISTTRRRDFDWSSNDNVAFYLDPYDDKTNGFSFQVTPNNVQREGLVLLGGDVRDDWDNKWYSAVSKGENYWSAEISIPFKTIRYNNTPEWNLQVLRNNLKRNERTAWIQVPQGYRMSNMTFSGRLNWDEPPKPAGPNVTVIPYIASSAGKDHEEGEPAEYKLDGGFDAKVAVSSSINVDLTFNPDFSQVEVDQQVTNLQRFELFFPERRQFFLENQDLFADGGFFRSRPFFSRRIGIQGSGDTRRNVPIIAGARLSGKIGSKWRVGALNMMTNRDETSEEISPAQNYSVAVLERQIFSRSRLSAIFVGRNNLGESAVTYDSTTLANTGDLQDQFGNELNPKDTLVTLSEYNYVFGLDYNLANIDNSWEGDFFYHRSLDPGVSSDEKYATGAFLRYQKPTFGARVNFQRIGENHNAEVGFVPRPGVTNYGAGTEFNIFPAEGSIVQRHGPGIGFGGVLTNDWERLDNDAGFEYRISFLNTSYLEIGSGWDFVSLTSSFDPSGSDGRELEENTRHSWYRYRIFYRTDRRKNFIVRASVSNGGFFNGKRFNAELGLTFRLPPVMQIQLNGEYNKVNLPAPYNDADLFLIGPRFDLTLSNKVFFTTFIQYNSQRENLGHNSRFQWRFKPVSDIFLVYTDNYITDGFQTRNRAIVFKVNYWLNL